MASTHRVGRSRTNRAHALRTVSVLTQVGYKARLIGCERNSTGTVPARPYVHIITYDSSAPAHLFDAIHHCTQYLEGNTVKPAVARHIQDVTEGNVIHYGWREDDHGPLGAQGNQASAA